jgi:hypothetical protein
VDKKELYDIEKFTRWLYYTKNYFAVDGKLFQAGFENTHEAVASLRLERDPVFEIGVWRAGDWARFGDRKCSWIKDDGFRKQDDPRIDKKTIELVMSRLADLTSSEPHPRILMK